VTGLQEVVETTFRNRAHIYAHLPEPKIERMRRKIMAKVEAAYQSGIRGDEIIKVIVRVFEEQERSIKMVTRNFDQFEPIALVEW